MEKKSSLVVLILGVVAVAVLIICMAVGTGDPKISIADGLLNIDCFYGTKVSISDIQEVQLEENSFGDIAPYWYKTNGFNGFDGALKGNFRTDNLGNILIYIQMDAKPLLVIKRVDKNDVYISFSEPQKTRDLYETLNTLIY